MEPSAFTENDAKCMEQILSKHPDWNDTIIIPMEQFISTVSINDMQKFHFELPENKWKMRQLAHIIASKHGFHSRKIMTNIPSGDWWAKCSNCRCLLIPAKRYRKEYMDGFCCLLCDGICPNNCRYWYPKTSGGLAWAGVIEFSRERLKLGKRARNKKRNWKNGKIKNVKEFKDKRRERKTRYDIYPD
jgi:hypothetical protein